MQVLSLLTGFNIKQHTNWELVQTEKYAQPYATYLLPFVFGLPKHILPMSSPKPINAHKFDAPTIAGTPFPLLLHLPEQTWH